MKISFAPETKDDWRLLLNLAKEIRLAKKEALQVAVALLKEKREEDESMC